MKHTHTFFGFQHPLSRESRMLFVEVDISGDIAAAKKTAEATKKEGEAKVKTETGAPTSTETVDKTAVKTGTDLVNTTGKGLNTTQTVLDATRKVGFGPPGSLNEQQNKNLNTPQHQENVKNFSNQMTQAGLPEGVVKSLDQIVQNQESPAMQKIIMTLATVFAMVYALKTAGRGGTGPDYNTPDAKKKKSDEDEAARLKKLGVTPESEKKLKAAQTEAKQITDKGEKEAKDVTDKGATEAKQITDKAAADAKALTDKAAGESKSLTDKAGTDGKALTDKAAVDGKALVDKVRTDGGDADAIAKAEVASKALTDKAAAEAKALTDKAAADGKATTDKAETEAKAIIDKGGADAKAVIDQAAKSAKEIRDAADKAAKAVIEKAEKDAKGTTADAPTKEKIAKDADAKAKEAEEIKKERDAIDNGVKTYNGRSDGMVTMTVGNSSTEGCVSLSLTPRPPVDQDTVYNALSPRFPVSLLQRGTGADTSVTLRAVNGSQVEGILKTLTETGLKRAVDGAHETTQKSLKDTGADATPERIQKTLADIAAEQKAIAALPENARKTDLVVKRVSELAETSQKLTKQLGENMRTTTDKVITDTAADAIPKTLQHTLGVIAGEQKFLASLPEDVRKVDPAATRIKTLNDATERFTKQLGVTIAATTDKAITATPAGSSVKAIQDTLGVIAGERKFLESLSDAIRKVDPVATRVRTLNETSQKLTKELGVTLGGQTDKAIKAIPADPGDVSVATLRETLDVIDGERKFLATLPEDVRKVDPVAARIKSINSSTETLTKQLGEALVANTESTLKSLTKEAGVPALQNALATVNSEREFLAGLPDAARAFPIVAARIKTVDEYVKTLEARIKAAS